MELMPFAMRAKSVLFRLLKMEGKNDGEKSV